MYADYLKTDHWREVKKRHYRLARRKKCYICGSYELLNVHHLVYKDCHGVSFLGRENSGILRTFCADCHHLYHKYFEISGKTKYLYRIINLILAGVPKENAFKVVSRGKKPYRRILKNFKSPKPKLPPEYKKMAERGVIPGTN